MWRSPRVILAYIQQVQLPDSDRIAKTLHMSVHDIKKTNIRSLVSRRQFIEFFRSSQPVLAEQGIACATVEEITKYYEFVHQLSIPLPLHSYLKHLELDAMDSNSLKRTACVLDVIKRCNTCQLEQLELFI